MNVPQKIVLKSTTKLSLNERFSALPKPQSSSQVVQRQRDTVLAERQASAKNRRLAQQMARRPSVQAALKLKKRSLKQRLGIQARLSAGPAQGSQTGQVNRGNFRTRGRVRGNRGSQMRSRGFVRGNYRGTQIQRGARSRGGRGSPRRGSSGLRSSFRGRGRGLSRGSSPRGGRRRGNYQNRGFTQRGRYNRGRGGRGRGRGRGRGGQNKTKEQLDTEMDAYMSKTKSSLDNELDLYMSGGAGDA